MANERRYCRLEDWEGNEYSLAGSGGHGGGGVGGEILTADKIETDKTKIKPTTKFFANGIKIEDARSQSGKAIVLDYNMTPLPAGQQNLLFKGLFDNIPLGNISINLRMLPMFKREDWFKPEYRGFHNLEVFEVYIKYFNNITKQYSEDMMDIRGIVKIENFKTFPIVPMNTISWNMGTNTRNVVPLESTQYTPLQLQNKKNYGEISIVLPFMTKTYSKNYSCEVTIGAFKEDKPKSQARVYEYGRDEGFLQNIMLDSISVTKAAGSVTSAPYFVYGGY